MPPVGSAGMVFDLMFSLDATEEQLDFPTIYGSAKQGWMSEDWKEPKEDITAVLDAIIKYIPEPKMLEGTPQMLITSLDYSKYVGRIAVGRVHRGELKEGQDVMLCKRDGSMVKSRIKEVDVFEGLGRTKVDSVQSGDICAIIGIDGFEIGETIADVNEPEPLPTIAIDEPTMSMLSRSTILRSLVRMVSLLLPVIFLTVCRKNWIRTWLYA